jgi:tetratricopeptide (TPR) repeat protein
MPIFARSAAAWLSLAVLLAAAPASAQTGAGTGQGPLAEDLSDAERYAACLDLARSEPAAGIERARTWQDTGGGDPARHCEAVALLARGNYPAAGTMLEDLAKTMSARHGADMRAHALAQAGRAWMLAGKPARAEAAQTAAIDLTPQDVELWIDRAHARFQAGAYWEAIDDLNRAEELAPGRPDIYAYRASAYRYVDALGMARENVERALELDPDHPEALFESGILHRIDGATDAARSAWMTIIRQAPESPTADAARENLEKMDVQPDGGS